MMESQDEALNINSLPKEILINIFTYFSHNELGRIARVCRTWNVLTRSPALWKKVHLVFHRCPETQKNVTRSITTLPPCVTRIRLSIVHGKFWDPLSSSELNFEQLSRGLQERCPHLERFILEHAVLSENLPSVVHLCTRFLPDVKFLIFHYCVFKDGLPKKEIGGTSNCEVLDIFMSFFLGEQNNLPFSKMPHVKELRLAFTNLDDSWFKSESTIPKQLTVLDLGKTGISSRQFQAMRNQTLNLKELYLCLTDLKDNDFNLNNSVFPHLETICLRNCRKVTCEGIVSLVQSCQSLQNVYVEQNVAETYATHPFIVANKCKIEIVKVSSHCFHHRRPNYFW